MWNASYLSSKWFYHFSVNPTVFVYGKLPYKVENDFQSNIALFQMVSTDIGFFNPFFSKKKKIMLIVWFCQPFDETYKMETNPVKVLNQLGKHGFQVVGFAFKDDGMAWTLGKNNS